MDEIVHLPGPLVKSCGQKKRDARGQ